MVLNYIWIGFFVVAFIIALVKVIFLGDTEIFTAIMNATFDSSKTAFEISLGLTGVLALWLGIMKIGENSGLINALARFLSPVLCRLFPDIPKEHPVLGSIFMNMSANMLGLDNAATPLGLKAMKELQELNPKKDTASNPMIMFLVINTSGLIIIPISIMVYRAQMGAAQPTDVFIPILLSTFISTLVGVIAVSIAQKINLINKPILILMGVICLFFSGLVYLFLSVSREDMGTYSTLIANILLFSVIILFILTGVRKKINVYDSFVEGAKEGFTTAVRIIPYLVAFLVGIAVFRKATGALIEVFLLEPYNPADYEQMFQTRGECEWLCMIGNLKKWKGEVLQRTFDVNSESVTLKAERLEDVGKSYRVRFTWDNAEVSLAELLDAVGELPIPPYLNRETQESDKTTYQTVYSKVKGSVAAPTAGLHFTPEVLAAIDRRGIDREELTLHVGAGTFKPVKSEEIQDHEMHTEYVCVHRETLEKLIKHGAEAIAVGTTSVRTLESLYYMGVKLEQNMDLSEEELHVNQWEPYENEAAKGVTPMKALENIVAYLDKHGLSALHSSTQIIIAPGYEYKIVKMLVTNFHQPQSTLLLLVSAFLHGDWHKVYDYALAHDFRFLSYGDSSLLIP